MSYVPFSRRRKDSIARIWLGEVRFGARFYPGVHGGVHGPDKGGVLTAAVPEPKRPGRLDEVKVEPVRAVLECGRQPAERRRGTQDPQPKVIDVRRARVETEPVDNVV